MLRKQAGKQRAEPGDVTQQAEAEGPVQAQRPPVLPRPMLRPGPSSSCPRTGHTAMLRMQPAWVPQSLVAGLSAGAERSREWGLCGAC
jgi:hypothetical protein